MKDASTIIATLDHAMFYKSMTTHANFLLTTFIVISRAASPELKRFIDRAQQFGMLA